MSYRTAARGPRRKGLLALGGIVLLGGLAAGIGIAGAGQSTYEKAVVNLARVPVGCDTEIEVEDSATFVVYVELAGEIGDLRGDCDNVDTDYERDDEPDVDIAIFDGDDEVDIERYDGTSYDVDGFVGTAVGRVELEEGESYVVRVQSDDDDFAVAIGRDPKGDADTAATIGVVVAGAGLLVGIVLIVLGLRRRPIAPGPGLPTFPLGEPTPFGAPAPGSAAPVASPPLAPPAPPALGGAGMPPPAPESGPWAPPPGA